MDYLPLFFKLEGQPVLLVGGGSVALRKATLLTRAGAKVSVVSHEICPELDALLAQHQGEAIIGEYHSALAGWKRTGDRRDRR